MSRDIESRLVDKTAKGIAEATTRAIREGAYAEGDQLPTIRSLAQLLDVSPSTVASAWMLLARAGVVHSDRRRGTTVSPLHPGPERTRRALAKVAAFGLDLSTGLPDAALLPDLRPALGRLEVSLRPETYLDEPVIPGLAHRLARDWPFKADVHTVVDGAHDGLDLVIATNLRYGDRVAVEAATDANLLDLLEAAGVQLVPVEIDSEGMVPQSLAAALRGGCHWVFAQPRAQYPTGCAWSSQRAEEIADVIASDASAVLVEVDFSAHIATSRLMTVGARLPKQVIHIRGYADSHGAELRMAAIGGPSRLMADLIERRHLGQGWSSRILQMLLLDLLEDPAARRQVARARKIYSRRRARFVAELSERGIYAEGVDGFFVRVRVTSETGVLVALASQGIGVAPGATNVVDDRESSHIVVTSGLLPEDQAATVAAAIAVANQSRRRSRA